ncbi:MAG: hypothetical protein HZB23_05585 [Deltaproteobacteria bacterium]|nr:hypothetical protein [Deltaproteobacteria bacterium]
MLTVDVSPAFSGDVLVNGTASPPYPHTYPDIPSGSHPRLTTDAADGFVFSHWTGAYNGVAETVDLTLSCDQSITAHFAPGMGVIKGTAFADQDGDGLRDPSETGVEGITASAFGPDGAFLASSVTTNQGGFRIAVAEPGNYSLAFSAPDGAKFSVNWHGTDNALDSDPDPSSGHTRLMAISDAAPEAVLDAGYIVVPAPVPISDPVPPASDSGGGGGCFVRTIF